MLHNGQQQGGNVLRHYLIPFLLCFAITGTTAPLAAQSVPPAPVPPEGDTSAWRPVLQYLVETLAPYVARAATITNPQPWTIALPDTTAPWHHIGVHLNAILRARLPTPADSAYFELRLSSLQIRGDTAFAQINWGLRKRCSDGRFRGGYGNRTETFVVRIVRAGSHMWSAAHRGIIRHGDSFC
jgi:hypothetical protein